MVWHLHVNQNRIARWVSALAWMLLIGDSLAAAQGIKPDYASTQAFGWRIQEAYQQKGIESLVEQLDSAGAARRETAGMHADAIQDRSLSWFVATSIPTWFRTELKQMSRNSFFAVGRVMALNGNRALECMFIAQTGAIRVVYFYLSEPQPGEVKIVDWRSLGRRFSRLQESRFSRLFTNGGVLRLGSPEEMEIGALIVAMNHSDDQVFIDLGLAGRDRVVSQLLDLGAVTQADPTWRRLRDRLVKFGVSLPEGKLRPEGRWEITLDALDRYFEEVRNGTEARARDAYVEASNATFELPLLPLLGVEGLLGKQQFAEALNLAERLRDVYPVMPLAHAAIIRTHVLMGEFEKARLCLTAARKVVRSEILDRLLALDPKLAEWRSSRAYHESLDPARPLEPVTAPVPDGPR